MAFVLSFIEPGSAQDNDFALILIGMVGNVGQRDVWIDLAKIFAGQRAASHYGGHPTYQDQHTSPAPPSRL
jgi:hypothetical protein